MDVFFASNLKLLRKRKGRTQDDVAVVTGIKRPTLSGYENSGVFPSVDALIMLSDYLKVSIDTLLRIDLTKLSEFQLSELERGNDVFIRGTNLRVLATTVNSHDEENIELVQEKAKAGYATGYADPEFISELPKFNLPFLSKNKKYRTFQINGDSMLPIPHGSWITAEFVQDWHTISSGKPYIILTISDGVVFKIADNLIQDENKLRLYSLNSLYEPYDASVQDIKEVWRFINFISTDIPEPEAGGHHLSRTVYELKHEMEIMKKKVYKGRSL
jgi:transcriptional regulator with XRE-family HTH domain